MCTPHCGPVACLTGALRHAVDSCFVVYIWYLVFDIFVLDAVSAACCVFDTYRTYNYCFLRDGCDARGHVPAPHEPTKLRAHNKADINKAPRSNQGERVPWQRARRGTARPKAASPQLFIATPSTLLLQPPPACRLRPGTPWR